MKVASILHPLRRADSVSISVNLRWDLESLMPKGSPLQGFGYPEGSLRDSTDMIVRMVKFSLLY